MEASIRAANPTDLPRILAITNEAIATTDALWVEAEQTLPQMQALHRTRAEAGMPWVVAELDGYVVGFGSLVAFRAYAGFRQTVEHSLYVDRGAQRRGIGRTLLTALEACARSRDMHALIGAIGADNAASLALHHAAGFAEVGRLPEVGIRFGRRLDLVLMQKLL